MSAKIILDNISTSSMPASFSDEITFEVTFSVVEPTQFPINWKVTYVGSAYSEKYDQVLQEFDIDPIETPGIMKFDIACKSPDVMRIPRNQLICVTALILTASYQNQQFIRVGYYVHNQLSTGDEQVDINSLELNQLVGRIKRTVISDKPRVTKFKIRWANRKNCKNQDSQSKLSDYFSLSKSQHEDGDSSYNKLACRQEMEKQSTIEENSNMIAE